MEARHRKRLPPDVLGLLRKDVASVLELEVLVLLARDPLRTWSAGQVASLLEADPQAVCQGLARLNDRGILVSRARADDPSFTIGPTGTRLARTVQRLTRAYTSDRSVVLQALLEILIDGRAIGAPHRRDCL